MKKYITTLSLLVLMAPGIALASPHNISAEDLITGRYQDEPEDAGNAIVYGGIALVVVAGGCFLLHKVRHGGAGETEHWKK